MVKNKVELLSPAGSIDSFYAAINSGADAIYMGIDRFNARNMATNFSINEYIECIKYAHILGVKVYLTLNTLLYDDEIKEALDIVSKLYSYGLDAVIVQDIGIASLLHELLPTLPLHASTQMSVYSLGQVKFLEKLGFTRVVLAREVTIDEIENICKNTSLEIEIFIHGALCVCYSGQCLLSQVVGGRSANRGNCAQPCRMKYTLFRNDKKIEKSKYLLSKKDIMGLDYLSKLINIGVTSFKIEGRNKTPEYVAGITRTYRKYIDDILLKNKKVLIDDEDKRYVMQIFNRDGISSGYLDGVKYKESITSNIPKNTGLYLGEVIDQKKEYIKLHLQNDISLHDGIEVIHNGDVLFSNIVTCIKDKDSNILNTKTEKSNTVWLGDIKKKVPFGAKVYKTSDYSINNELKKYYDGAYKRRRNIDILVCIKEGKNIFAATKGLDKEVVVPIEYIPQIAKSKPLDKDTVVNVFSKTLDTPFKFSNIDLDLDNNLFVPIAKLNELRRNLIAKILELFNDKVSTSNNIQDILNRPFNIEKNKYLSITKPNILYIYKYNKAFDYFKWYEDRYNKKLDIVYINAQDMYANKEAVFNFFKNKAKIYLVLPNVAGKKLDKYIFENIEKSVQEGVEGLVIGSIGYIDLALNLKSKYNIVLVADYSLNIFNKYSIKFYTNLGFDIVCPSIELREEDIEKIGENTNIEVLTDFQTVMTSRYCILGSYIGRENTCLKCNMPCVRNDKFYILDEYDKKYNILCDNIDCIMKIVASRNRFKNTSFRVRRCIL